MIKSVKRICAAVLSAVMMLTAVATPLASAAAEGTFLESVTGETGNNNVVTATAGDGDLIYGDNGALTKAEWLHDLVTVFDMKVEEGDAPDNYFTDVAYDSKYYDDIMLATEFGVVNVEAGGELGPDDTVDREYASVTLNFCLGFQLDDDTYTFSESSDEAYADELTAFQVALNRNWFALSGGAFLPSKAVTSAEAKAMLSDAQQVLADAQIDDTKEGTFEFADYVIDFTPYQVVEFNEDDTVTIYAPDKVLAVGDTFVVYDQELPFVYTATAIKTDGSDIIVTTTDAPDDAIVNYVAEGTIKADIATFNPADNVDVTYVKDDATALTMSKARGVTVTKDSIMVDMKIPISSGIDVSVSCDIKNIALHHKEDKLNGYYYASVSGETTLTTSLNIDPLKGSGVSGKYYLGYINTGVFSASLYAELSLSGKLMTVYTGNFEAGVSYQRFKGFRVIKSFTKKSFNFCADISAKVAMTAECKIDLVLLEAKANVSIGIQAKYNKTVYGDDKLPGICEDIQAYLYAGGSVSATIIKVATFSKSFDFIDKNNSPYRLYLHYDDGNQVDVCGRDISDPSSPTPVRRYTSPSSTGFGSRWSSSQSSKWHSGSNGSSAQQPEKLWEYSLDDDKNATITAYNGYSSSLVIPTKIDGYTVTAIGDRAFADNTRLVMVVIPDSVTVIGNYAFNGCTSLSKVNLSKMLETLNYGAFQNCTSLVEIEIPKSLKYANYDTSIFNGIISAPFMGSGIKKVKFETGIKEVVECLFLGCNELEQIEIPNTVTRIGNHSFRMCPNLEKINIPSSVTSVGEYAFSSCTSLKSIIIPDSVTTIECHAFDNCSLLSEVTLSNNLQSLYYGAFQNCTSLCTIEIPKSLEYANFDTYIFQGIISAPFMGSGLEQIKFETGTKTVIDCLFLGCDKLEKVEIPETVTSIGNYAFSMCKSLSEISISDSVTSIGSDAFSSCTALVKIDIPDSVTVIGSNAFKGCTSLSDVSLSKNLQTLNYGAFQDCTSLVEIEIPKSLEYANFDTNVYGGIVSAPFMGSSLKKIKFENGIKSIADCLFYGCNELVEVEIPDTISSIGYRSFGSCGSLSKISIPDSVSKIGSHAFAGCNSLSSITLSKNIQTLGDYAFYGCNSLLAIEFPPLLTEIEDGMCYDCTSLKNITLAPETEYICSYAFSNCDALENIVIPDKVTAIYNNAFSDCDKLSSVTLSKALEQIGESAFNNCDALTSIKIPDSVETIGERAFYDCEKLADVDMGNGVSKLYSEAFRLCPALTKIVLSNNLTSIPEYAFADCTKLTDVTIYPGVTEIATNAFSYPAKTTMRGLKGSYAETYANDRGMTFETITSVDASMLTVKFKNDYDGYEAAPSYTYTGKPFKPDVKVYLGSYELTAGTDYKIVSYKNNTKIGTATCTIQGLGTYTGTTTGSFTIAPIPLPGNSWYYSLEYSNYDYTGKEIRPAVTCEGLTEGIDFTVSYKDNTNAGTAQVIITGIGNYSGTYTLEFTINPVTICTDVSQLQSKHPYDENVHEVYVYNGAEGAENLYLTFSDDTQFEEYCDYLYIYDANGYEVGSYTGDELSGKTITVPGSYVKLVLNTDSSNNEYGFRVVSASDKLECATHVFGDWKITEEATCTTTGTKTRACTVCGKVETVTIAKTAHKYVNTVVKPTYTVQGYTLHTCSVCGYSYKDNYTPALKLTELTGVKVKTQGSTSLTLAWDKNASAKGYIIEQYKGGKWTQIAKTSSNATVTYTVNGLKADTTYTFRIKGYVVSGTTEYSGEYTRLAAKTRIANVASFKGSAVSASAVKLDWSKNDKATGYVIEQYKGGKWTAIATTKNNTTLTFTVKGLAEGTTYSFRIKSFRKTGSTTEFSEYTAIKAAALLDGVSDFKVTSVTGSWITLEWAKNDKATGYVIEQYKGGKWTVIATTKNNTTLKFTVKGLKNDTTYSFRIRAYKTASASNVYSDYVRIAGKTRIPNVAKFTGSAVSASAVKLDWSENDKATGYVIEQYKGGKWTALATTKNNTTLTFTVKGLAKGTAYSFRIKSFRKTGSTTEFSEYTAIKAATLLDGVSDFKVASTTGSWITLEWAKNDKATGYSVEQYKGGKWTVIATTKNNTTLKFTVKGLKNDTTYSFRIRAYKTAGASNVYSDYVRIAGKTRIPNVAKFTGSAVSASAVKLDWSKNDKATAYVIEQYKGGKWTALATTKNNTTLTFTVKGLAKGTAYSFRIKSFRKTGSTTEFSEYASVKAATDK